MWGKTSDSIDVIDRWAEEKRPPEAMTAEEESKEHTGRIRPLCKCPQDPRYRGKSLDLAASCQKTPQRHGAWLHAAVFLRSLNSVKIVAEKICINPFDFVCRFS